MNSGARLEELARGVHHHQGYTTGITVLQGSEQEVHAVSADDDALHAHGLFAEEVGRPRVRVREEHPAQGGLRAAGEKDTR